MSTRTFVTCIVAAAAVSLAAARPCAAGEKDDVRLTLRSGASTNGLAAGMGMHLMFEEYVSAEVNLEYLDGIWAITGGGRYWFADDERAITPYIDAQIGGYQAPAWKTDGAPDAAFGFNVGAGAEWDLTESIALGPFARLHHALLNDPFTNLEFGLELSVLIK